MARAVIFHEPGGPEVLRIEEVAPRPPGENEIRIRVEAFGLNRSEALYRQGWHPIKPPSPSRLGYEAVGRVEALGAGVTGFALGDRVSTLPTMDLNKHGCYGETLTAPSAVFASTPPELSVVEAAALWSSYMTAYGGLVDLVTIQPGDFVLVTAASSSVGPPAIQILTMLGAKPIAVTRSRAKVAEIAAMGSFATIALEDEDLGARIRDITDGHGVDLVFDAVGGSSIPVLADITRPYGKIILYGVLSGEAAPLPPTILQKNLTLHGFAMYLWDKPDRNERAIDYIRRGVTAGHLRPVISRVFTFDEVIEASRYLDTMQQIGKVVVTI